MRIRHCELRKKEKIRLLKFFAPEITARSSANILGLQANTVALFYRKIRQIIVENFPGIASEKGKFKADDSCFGSTQKGKRGRGAAGKVPVFGILKRGGKVYTKMIAGTKSQTLFDALKLKVLPDSVVYADSYMSCNILDVSDLKHYHINHSKLFAHKQIISTVLRTFGIRLNVF